MKTHSRKVGAEAQREKMLVSLVENDCDLREPTGQVVQTEDYLV